MSGVERNRNPRHLKNHSPKKLYMRSMRIDTDVESAGDGQSTPDTSEPSIKGSACSSSDQESVHSVDSTSIYGENEVLSNMKNLSSPWTPPSWGSILSPGTPSSSAKGPVIIDLSSPKPPSVVDEGTKSSDTVATSQPSPTNTVTRRFVSSSDSDSGIGDSPSGWPFGKLQHDNRAPRDNIAAASFGPWSHKEKSTQAAKQPDNLGHNKVVQTTASQYIPDISATKLSRSGFCDPQMIQPVPSQSVKQPSSQPSTQTPPYRHWPLQPPLANYGAPSTRQGTQPEYTCVSRDVTLSRLENSHGTSGKFIKSNFVGSTSARPQADGPSSSSYSGLDIGLHHSKSEITPNRGEYSKQQQENEVHTSGRPMDYEPSKSDLRRVHPGDQSKSGSSGLPSSSRPDYSGKPERELLLEDISSGQEAIRVEQALCDSGVVLKQEVVDPAYETQVAEVGQSESGEGVWAEGSLTCQVCGDVSAGFHCGSYVCEACKKFFVRCVKSDCLKFTCPRDQQCVINRETRTQCQYCRYQKCLALGMYKPGGTNVSSEISHMPCSVCGAPSSGFHFGAITCEGCKGFFRRTVKERDTQKYHCGRGSNCTITTSTRNVCKFCRYRKCLDVGMKADGSRIGRQPNSVKHATMLQLQQIKMAKGLPVKFEVKPQPFLTTQKSEGDGDGDCGTEDGCDVKEDVEQLTDSSRRESHERDRVTQEMEERVTGQWSHEDSQPIRDNTATTSTYQNESPPVKAASHSKVGPVGNELRDEVKVFVEASPGSFAARDMGVRDWGEGKHGHPEPTGFTGLYNGKGPREPMGHYTGKGPREVAAHYSGKGPRDPTGHYNTGKGPREVTNHYSGKGPHNSSGHLYGGRDSHVYPPWHSDVAISERLRQVAPPQVSVGITSRPPSLFPPPHSTVSALNQLTSRKHQEEMSHYPEFPSGPTSHLNVPLRPPGFPPDLMRLPVSAYNLSPTSQLQQFSLSQDQRQPASQPEPSPRPQPTPLTQAVPVVMDTTEPPSIQQSPPEVVKPAVDVVKPVGGETKAAPGEPKPAAVSERRSTGGTVHRRDYTSGEVLSAVQNAYRELMPVLKRNPDLPTHLVTGLTVQEGWDVQMKQFSQCALATLKFAKKIPGFKSLPIQEQIRRVQESMYPMVLALLSTDYDLDSRQYNYFNMTREEEEVVLNLFPEFRALVPTFHMVGFSIRTVNLDNTELAFLCAMKLMSAVEDQYLEDILIIALERYCEEKSMPVGRAGQVILRLGEMARINTIHQKTVIGMSGRLKQEGLAIPQLFEETFLNIE